MATSRLLSGGDNSQIVHFSYQSPSQMTLQALLVGQIVEYASVVIDTPFDDLGASIEIGIAANLGAVLSRNDIVTSIAGQYETDGLMTISVPELLILTIDPGQSTQGSGYLLYRVRK